MIRIRNAFSRLIRVGRNRATAPDSLPPFIRIVKDQPCPYCGSKFPNRPLRSSILFAGEKGSNIADRGEGQL
jgi:hypothetical protein